MKHPKDFLALVYYIALLLVILATMGGYYLAYNKGIYLHQGDGRITPIYSIIIIYVLASLPAALVGFNLLLKRMRKYPDDGTREHYYKIYGSVRIIVLTIGLIASVLGLYLLQERSLLWLAGIAAIGLIFCKPTQKRVDADLEIISNKEEEI